MSNKGSLIVMSAPSGCGKTSLAKRALREMSDMTFSVSHTTRQPREGEREGVDYFFVSKDDFQKMVEQDAFLEYAHVYGNDYGTSRDFVDAKLDAGYDVLLDLDVQGAAQVKERYPAAILLFVLPPSLEALQRRLRNRGLDDPGVIADRLKIARKVIEYYTNYQFVIINKEIEESLLELKSIIQVAGYRMERRKALAEEILKTFPENS
ncbi:MAG: guanylate kinase [Acidobacteriota bacterium]